MCSIKITCRITAVDTDDNPTLGGDTITIPMRLQKKFHMNALKLTTVSDLSKSNPTRQEYV
jgi:hypothetical protein